MDSDSSNAHGYPAHQQGERISQPKGFGGSCGHGKQDDCVSPEMGRDEHGRLECENVLVDTAVLSMGASNAAQDQGIPNSSGNGELCITEDDRGGSQFRETAYQGIQTSQQTECKLQGDMTFPTHGKVLGMQEGNGMSKMCAAVDMSSSSHHSMHSKTADTQPTTVIVIDSHETDAQDSNSKLDEPTKQVSYKHMGKLRTERTESTGDGEYYIYPIHIAALCRALLKAPMHGLLKQASGRGIKKPPANKRKLIHLIAKDMMGRM